MWPFSYARSSLRLENLTHRLALATALVSDQCTASNASDNMSKKFIFFAAEDEILLDEIQKNKVIFDSSDLSHKDKNIKDSIWMDMGIKLNRNSKTSTNVETQNIMSNDSFRDEEGTVDVENESNSKADIPNLPAVSFGGKRLRSKDEKLSAILAKRSKERNEMLSNIQAQNNLLASQNQQQEDEVDVFFKSIAMTVKKLPSWAINEAKLRVLTMVSEIEEKYVVPDHTKTIRSDYILPLNINNMTQWLSPANSSNTAALSSSYGFVQLNHNEFK
ncbi:hypothetical protein ACI65C_006880 [Semiaphis heraclei]